MKKSLFVFVIVYHCVFVKAQTIEPTASTNESKIKPKVSVGMMLGYLDLNTMEMIFRSNKKSKTFRLSLNIDDNQEETYYIPYTEDNNASINLMHQIKYDNKIIINTGFEKYFTPEKTASFYFGSGVSVGWGFYRLKFYESIYKYNPAYSLYETIVENQFKQPQSKALQNSMLLGVHALCGGRFSLSQHINFTTEIMIRMLYRKNIDVGSNITSFDFSENLNLGINYCFN